MYARINVPWVGIDSGWVDNTGASTFNANAPETDAEQDPYVCQLIMTVDNMFGSDDSVIPYTAGQVVKLVSDPYEFTGEPLIFSKP